MLCVVQVTSSMSGVVKAMESAMKSMNLEKVNPLCSLQIHCAACIERELNNRHSNALLLCCSVQCLCISTPSPLQKLL